MLFWIGVLSGVGLALLVNWLKKKTAVRWYEWLIGALGLLSGIGAIQHYFGSLGENEPTSAWMGFLLFSIIALILLAIAWALFRRHKRTA
ncbi:MAG: dehalogenase [Dehalococcoides mccartyi]|uniref:dehalogenase n=1 Tax=Dehalococcoides mccartyi TaxID=61435 RepID=UPI0008049F83|nr:dehalogenase [Dehalococcoides mccartyi]OBW62573.1 MAG: dehalogenase [Dehalococcoides mccartyi]